MTILTDDEADRLWLLPTPRWECETDYTFAMADLRGDLKRAIDAAHEARRRGCSDRLFLDYQADCNRTMRAMRSAKMQRNERAFWNECDATYQWLPQLREDAQKLGIE